MEKKTKSGPKGGFVSAKSGPESKRNKKIIKDKRAVQQRLKKGGSVKKMSRGGKVKK